MTFEMKDTLCRLLPQKILWSWMMKTRRCQQIHSVNVLDIDFAKGARQPGSLTRKSLGQNVETSV